MKAAPKKLYKDLVRFAGGTHDAKRAIARPETLFGADYAISYLYASRLLLEGSLERNHLNAVSVQIGFLQRHAFELFLKDSILALQRCKFLNEVVGALEADAKAAIPQARRLKITHRLSRLLIILKHKAANGHVNVIVPDEIGRIARRLTKLERDEHTVWRYHWVKTGKAFARESRLPLGSLQEQLEKLFRSRWLAPAVEEVERLWSRAYELLLNEGRQDEDWPEADEKDAIDYPGVELPPAI